MINFLRKLRRKEMKGTKYLKYAVGEIVLVVVGILIALGLNNLNTNQINSAKRTTLLKSLQSEFTANLAQLDTVLSYNNLVINAGHDFLGIIKLGSLLPQKQMDSISANFGWLWTFDPLNGGLASGISSGNIHLIKNDALTNLLFSWEDLVADAKEEENRAAEIALKDYDFRKTYERMGSTAKIYISALPEGKYQTNYKGLINDPEFESFVSLRMIFTYDLLAELNPIRDKNEHILALIVAELKN